MDSYASGKPSPAESLLSRRKEAIIARSMAEIERKLDIWLNQDELKPGKRRRGADDGDSVSGQQKRVRRDHLRFACPFAKHDPAKYKNVKTCCGPGWTELHRVKEHVYRRHSLKNACNRCLKVFKDAKGLMEHQRSKKTICEVSDRTLTNEITHEQEEQLRARSKANASPVELWHEMYRIIFPKAKLPSSPYYDAKEDLSEAPPPAEESRFSNIEECKAYVRQQVLLQIRPVIVDKVEAGIRMLGDQLAKTANELVRDLTSKITRTFRYQAQQQHAVMYRYSEPTPEADEDEPELEPEREPEAPPEMGDALQIDEIIGSLGADPMFSFLVPTEPFPWDPYMIAEDVMERACGDTTAVDSAYFTESRDADSLGSAGFY